MDLVKLACNCCGAGLEVAETTNFVTCHHCGSQLTIRRTENSTFTEQLDRLERKTDELSEQVESLTANSALEALDREWELERENFMIETKNGGRHLPTRGNAVGGGIAIAVFGTFWTIMAIAITSSGPSFGPFAIAGVIFPLFGVGFVIFGVISSITAYQKAEQYEQAHRRYRERRHQLTSDSRQD